MELLNGMKFENINDIFRREIVEKIETLQEENNSIAECIEMFRDSIYEEESDINNNGIYSKYLLIFFIDAIKMLLFSIKNNLATDEEKNLYCCLKDIEDYESLYAETSADPGLLSSIIYMCYNYCKMSYFGKINIMTCISPDEHEWLSGVVPTHKLDDGFYRSLVTIDGIRFAMEEEVKYQRKNFSTDMDEVNILELLGFVKAFSNFENENYINILLSIGIIDYSVSKYVYNNGCENEILLDHIDLYENYPLNDILWKLQTCDSFLKDALFMFYSLYFQGAYGSIKLSEDILDRKENDEIKKKLVLR